MGLRNKIVIALSVCVCAMFAFTANAQSAQSVLDKVISNYNKSKSMSANYAISSAQGHSAGSIIMSGNKFRILSPQVKCWFNGKTQWAYSPTTEEVNISNPTSSELQMSNPYSALVGFKRDFNVSMTQEGQSYILTMSPRKRNNVKQVKLYVSKSGYQIQKVLFSMSDRTTYTVAISGYKVGGNYPESTFIYNKNLVPKGTQVVDLR